MYRAPSLDHRCRYLKVATHFCPVINRLFFLLAAPHAGASFAASPLLPAMISSVQTYGEDPTRFHPHAHCLASDGFLAPDGSLVPIPEPDHVQIILRFRRRPLQIPLATEKISQRLVEILLSWRHPGFSVFQGDPVHAEDHEARERLARYMAHPPVGLVRLHYDPQMRQVSYTPKHHQGGAGPDSPGTITCPVLDFLAALCTHIPDAGQQLVRYYGAWSHVRRARTRKGSCAAARPAPSPDTQDGCAQLSKRTWARLIEKVYEADPLVCPRCSGPLKIISLIGDGAVIKKILHHLKRRDRPERPPPPAADRSIRYDPDIPGFEDVSRWYDAAE